MQDTYLIIGLAQEDYAVPIEHVLGLLKYDPDALSRPFGAESKISGFLTHQGSVIPVKDLRLALGLPSMADETQEVIQTLDTRKQDHINWLDELEASVRENRPFRLTTDPHACKFGKWYDNIRSSPDNINQFTNGNGTLDGILHAFDEPHTRIHALAVQVGQLVAEGQQDQAIKVIERTRNGDLHTMINLFDRARLLVSSLRRTLLLVLEHDGEGMGLLIDQVSNLRTLTDDDMQSITADSNLIKCMALPNPSQPPIAIVDVEALYDSAKAVAA